MPSKVGRFAIWERLRSRFLLEPVMPLITKSLGDQIVPVTNVDSLLLRPAAQDSILDLTAVAGSYVVGMTVPAGQRWHLRWSWRRATTAATQIGFVVDSVNFRITLNEIDEQTVNLGDTIVLAVGDTLGMFTTGNAGDNVRPVRLHYMIEDVSE